MTRRTATLAAVVSLLVALACGSPQPSVQAVASQPQAVTVYVTKTGQKYHRDGCSSLRRSRIPMSLDEAKRKGYDPCKNCHPSL